MNETILRALLHEPESITLDFKRDQYPLTTDEQKSELVKDLLAFANTPRAGDAHILIGAREQPTPPAILTGITQHLRDHELQQLVNKKLNRPISFRYEAHGIDDMQVGIITIDRVQHPPHYLRKAFGNLGKHDVPVRHGSSTSIATPDEIIRIVDDYRSAFRTHAREQFRRPRHGVLHFELQETIAAPDRIGETAERMDENLRDQVHHAWTTFIAQYFYTDRALNDQSNSARAATFEADDHLEDDGTFRLTRRASLPITPSDEQTIAYHLISSEPDIKRIELTYEVDDPARIVGALRNTSLPRHRDRVIYNLGWIVTGHGLYLSASAKNATELSIELHAKTPTLFRQAYIGGFTVADFLAEHVADTLSTTTSSSA